MSNRLRFTPLITLITACLLAPAAAQAAPKGKPITVRASTPGVQAKLTATKVKRGKITTYRTLRLRLRSDNQKWSKALTITGKGANVSYQRPIVELGDLNGDGAPDAWVTGFTGGAHCCTTLAAALSTGPNSWVMAKTQLGQHGFTTKDLDGDGTVELIGDDGRFDYAFTSHAGSSWPVVVLKASGTKFSDATKQFPALLREDAAEMRARWNGLADDRGAARAALAAGLADLLRLGALEEARAWVAEATTRGDLSGPLDPIWDVEVGAKLEEWGYLGDFTAIGLKR